MQKILKLKNYTCIVNCYLYLHDTIVNMKFFWFYYIIYIINTILPKWIEILCDLHRLYIYMQWLGYQNTVMNSEENPPWWDSEYKVTGLVWPPTRKIHSPGHIDNYPNNLPSFTNLSTSSGSGLLFILTTTHLLPVRSVLYA